MYSCHCASYRIDGHNYGGNRLSSLPLCTDRAGWKACYHHRTRSLHATAVTDGVTMRTRILRARTTVRTTVSADAMTAKAIGMATTPYVPRRTVMSAARPIN